MPDEPRDRHRANPADLRELAVRVEALAAEMTAIRDRMVAGGDSPTQRVSFRLDEGASGVRSGATALTETAADLARVLGRSDCAANWGACPEHGGTLRASGGVAWCQARRCRRAWNYNRLGLPCSEPAAYIARDPAGDELRWCAGHTLQARAVLAGDHTYITITGRGDRP
ncbi:MAG: hypothetical protein QOC93_3213 [Actinomycetota bacterium]|nr:hypothetical protein [Actinomycetota bacterium]